MKNPNFYIRLGGFLLILSAFFFYNNTVKLREQEQQLQQLTEKVEALEEQQEEILTAWKESYEERQEEKKRQEEVLSQLAAEKENEAKEAGDKEEKKAEEAAEAEADEEGYYLDGTFEGSGNGYGGTVTVQIVLKDQELQEITVVDAPGEDGAYLSRAKGLIPDILENQSTAVDTVSGATFSSAGILEAVNDALEKAENK